MDSKIYATQAPRGEAGLYFLLSAFPAPDALEDGIKNFATQLPVHHNFGCRSLYLFRRSCFRGYIQSLRIYLVPRRSTFQSLALSWIFAALAQAVTGLSRFYHKLELSAVTDVHRLLPSPAYYDDRRQDLPLVFDCRFAYDGRQSCHRIVAEAGFAPVLFFCGRIKGGGASHGVIEQSGCILPLSVHSSLPG